MSSNQAQGKSKQGRKASRGQPARQRLFSIAAWPKQRTFVGNLSVGGTTYKFSYEPSRAEAINKLLQLTGQFTVTDPRGRARALKSVRATLANSQGGIGTGPIRRQMIAADAPADTQTPSQPKQQVAGETEKPAGEKQAGSLPVTENTGPTSYCGVLYFHFEPLDATAIGVAADLTRVQLNVRLEPLDDTAKTLHGLYSYVVDALYGKRTDERLAAAAITELNRVFAG
jgi:hypothetical protein